jgi:prepilin-type processing-associated H-X9-DG protein
VPGASTESLPQTVVAYDRRGNHPGGRNVLTADGKVTWLTENLFQQNLKNPPQEGGKTNTKDSPR